jgi:UDP-glucuronate 4-epimerase
MSAVPGPILVTGVAGFIGFHVAERLLADGYRVEGMDNMNSYYDPTLKAARLARLMAKDQFSFRRLDLADRPAMKVLFETVRPETVIHLAAQAGVRYSLTNPHAYVESNLEGFVNVLEGCVKNHVKHLVFASSSSVYGSNTQMPFSTHQGVDHPISLYAATKKSNELLAHAYSSAFGLATTGLRFFTVYGPWGRPDMAMFIFAKAILTGQPIRLFNFGKMRRDFTYIDDIVDGVIGVARRVPAVDASWDTKLSDPSTSRAPYQIYNIGGHAPVDVVDVVRLLEKHLGRSAIIDLQPMQNGDVSSTFADIDDLQRDVGFVPRVSIEQGVQNFVAWYKAYHKDID